MVKEWWEPLRSRFGAMEETIQRSFTQDEIRFLADWCRRMGLKEVKEWLQQNRETTAGILVDMSKEGLAIFNSDPHLHDPAPYVWKYAAMIHCLAAQQSINFWAKVAAEHESILNWMEEVPEDAAALPSPFPSPLDVQPEPSPASGVPLPSGPGLVSDWGQEPICEVAGMGNAYLSFQEEDYMDYWPMGWPGNPFEDWD